MLRRLAITVYFLLQINSTYAYGAEQYLCADADVQEEAKRGLIKYLATKSGENWENFQESRKFKNMDYNLSLVEIIATPDKDPQKDGWCQATVLDGRNPGLRTEYLYSFSISNDGRVSTKVLEFMVP